ncbi:MAG: hypothetical protein NDJ90_03975 [Oligoflexia bacterium]|nr:hypothetical protein [Oligoflexia bacterium]
MHLSFPGAGWAASCSELYSKLAAIDPQLGTAFEEIQQLSPAAIRGERTPSWQDFSQLDRVLHAVKAGKTWAAQQGKLAELDQVLHELEASIAENPSLAALREASKAAPKAARPASGTTYAPTEYALKRQYQHLLWELNKELPKDLKIRGVRIPYDSRKPALIAQAREFVARQGARFDPYFQNAGFDDRESLKRAIRSFSDDARILYDRLEAEQVELAMTRPESARWWTPRVGFQNQRVTGSSQGMLNPTYRDEVEASLTGTRAGIYHGFDAEFKPNYGYLKPRPEDGLEQSVAANHYGLDVYIFKKERVRDRLTWTAGDSFGVKEYGAADVAYGAASDIPRATSWRGNLIPWKDRALMVPDLLPNAQINKLGYEVGIVERKRLRPPPMPAMPPEPVPPPRPQLVKPVAPPRPTLDPPVPPPGPSLPPRPSADRLPFPAQGEDTEDFLTRYWKSKEVHQYQAEVDQYKAKAWELLQAHQRTEAYQTYEKQATRWRHETGRLNQAYDHSEAYSRYLRELDEYQQLRVETIRRYEASPEYKAYEEEVRRYSEKVSALRMSHFSSPAYKSYLAEEEHAYEIVPLGMGRYGGTSLEPFSSPTNVVDYLELQYWGPLGLDDVEIFEFRGQPPAGEFLRELQKRGIKIRDGRVEPAVEWVP